MAEEFTGTLICEQTGAWTYVPVPDDVVERLGALARIPVKGVVNDAEFTGSVMTGPGGSRYLVVNKALRDRAGVTAGDTVTVLLKSDKQARTVDVPDDLSQGLSDHPKAQQYFKSLSYSRQKEYVTWVTGAKRADTRERRVAKSIELLDEGRTLK